MKKSVLKTCSLIFGILCLIGFIDLLCTSIILPHDESYVVWGSYYTQHYSGYFDTTYLSSMILTAFGAFWGLVLFFAVPGEKCRKECCTGKKTKSEEVKSESACSESCPVDDKPQNEEKVD